MHFALDVVHSSKTIVREYVNLPVPDTADANALVPDAKAF